MAARARRVIFLCMNGAPSHVDTFDHKPELSSADGKASDRPGRIPGAKLMGSPWKFRQHGGSGLWVSELFPGVAAHADELCVIRSMHTDLPAHPEAYLMLHTGSSQFIRPSLGAWTLYGLGTESDDLPGFIAIKPTGRNGDGLRRKQLAARNTWETKTERLMELVHGELEADGPIGRALNQDSHQGLLPNALPQ